MTSRTTSGRVGFIGLGTMGGPMARNLLKAGHHLTVFDVRPEAMAPFAAIGATLAPTACGAAAEADVLITMLPEPADVERAVLDGGGVIESLRRGGTLVEMSTIDPATTRRIGAALVAKGIRMLDCPVGKTAEHAVSGTLTLMVGGDAALLAEMKPLLLCMGSEIFHCGELGAGQAMKLCNNLLAATIASAASEVLATGVKAGLRLERMLEVMRTTMAWNAQLAVAMPQKGFRGDFSPGFMLRLAQKDVRLALGLVRAAGLEPVLGEATAAILTRGMQHGMGAEDAGAVLRLREQEAGVTVRLSAAAPT
ncbi:MAG: NAD(P)-dependent oxidoreductase [Terriglobales bacterium]